ncbi:replication protein RepA, partial [Cronobacter dublinensis subsp. dublinensis]|nr:replication protein RepA [Cronobacter dublinensis subsp. dublinensis]
SRKESAQALYTFIESLPPNPAPVSLARLRARLNLTSRTITQNSTVRKAMEQLKEIGYLDYTEIKRGRVVYFHIHYRRPKLRPQSLPGALPAGEELPADNAAAVEEQGEMVMLTKEELALLEKIRKGQI